MACALVLDRSTGGAWGHTANAGAAHSPVRTPEKIPKLEENFMVRKLALFLGVSAVVLLFASRPAQAQDRGEVYAGYSYMRFNPGNGTDGNNLNGFDISGQY